MTINTHDETVCGHCGTLYEVQSLFLCDVCKFAWRTPAWATVFTEVAVLAFFYEHELEPFALYDEFACGELRDAMERVTLLDERPRQLEVTVELDSDRLEVTLDDEARVVNVAEQPN